MSAHTASSGTLKYCIRCRTLTPLSDFYRHAQMRDGHLNVCKTCVKARVRNRERWLRENDPEWRERERVRSREKFRRNPVQSSTDRNAHFAVSNAVRDGRLKPAPNCEDCGHDFSEFRREAHHTDYSKPLDVEWLCALCHGKRHRIADEAHPSYP